MSDPTAYEPTPEETAAITAALAKQRHAQLLLREGQLDFMRALSLAADRLKRPSLSVLMDGRLIDTPAPPGPAP